MPRSASSFASNPSSRVSPNGFTARPATAARTMWRDYGQRIASGRVVAAREVAETFWLLGLDSQHRLIGNAAIAVTRGILNSYRASRFHIRYTGFRGVQVYGRSLRSSYRSSASPRNRSCDSTLVGCSLFTRQAFPRL